VAAVSPDIAIVPGFTAANPGSLLLGEGKLEAITLTNRIAIIR
jgi:hypothetical protein